MWRVRGRGRRKHQWRYHWVSWKIFPSEYSRNEWVQVLEMGFSLPGWARKYLILRLPLLQVTCCPHWRAHLATQARAPQGAVWPQVGLRGTPIFFEWTDNLWELNHANTGLTFLGKVSSLFQSFLYQGILPVWVHIHQCEPFLKCGNWWELRDFLGYRNANYMFVQHSTKRIFAKGNVLEIWVMWLFKTEGNCGDFLWSCYGH